MLAHGKLLLAGANEVPPDALCAGQPTRAGRGGGACGCESLLAKFMMLHPLLQLRTTLPVLLGWLTCFRFALCWHACCRLGPHFCEHWQAPLQASHMQGTAYWAAEGQGAYVQRPGSEAQRLQAADVDLSAPGLVVVGSASHLTAETQVSLLAWLSVKCRLTCNQLDFAAARCAIAAQS